MRIQIVIIFLLLSNICYAKDVFFLSSFGGIADVNNIYNDMNINQLDKQKTTQVFNFLNNKNEDLICYNLHSKSLGSIKDKTSNRCKKYIEFSYYGLDYILPYIDSLLIKHDLFEINEFLHFFYTSYPIQLERALSQEIHNFDIKNDTYIFFSTNILNEQNLIKRVIYKNKIKNYKIFVKDFYGFNLEYKKIKYDKNEIIYYVSDKEIESDLNTKFIKKLDYDIVGVITERQGISVLNKQRISTFVNKRTKELVDEYYSKIKD